MRSLGFEEYVSPNALLFRDVGRRRVSADGVFVRARAGIDWLETGHARGKVVVTI